jgi:hypothetical protein
VEIRLSRHSSRRIQLYKIDEATVREIVVKGPKGAGKHQVSERVPGHKYPIKVVYVVEEQEITVVTAYPLKKGGPK